MLIVIAAVATLCSIAGLGTFILLELTQRRHLTLATPDPDSIPTRTDIARRQLDD